MLKLREGGHADLTRFYTLFEVDFDSEELISKLSLHKGLMNGSVELLVMYDDESQLEMAYALCFVKGMYDYVLLKYFGVLPWYREKGLGVEAMRLLNKRYAGRQGIIAEITEFADPDPEHLKSFSSSSPASAMSRSTGITVSAARRRTFSSSPSRERGTSRPSSTVSSTTITPAALRAGR